MRSGITASLSNFPTMNEDGDFAKGFLDESHGRTASHVQGIFKSWILKNIQIIIVFQTSIETRSLFCQVIICSHYSIIRTLLNLYLLFKNNFVTDHDL